MQIPDPVERAVSARRYLLCDRTVIRTASLRRTERPAVPARLTECGRDRVRKDAEAAARRSGNSPETVRTRRADGAGVAGNRHAGRTRADGRRQEPTGRRRTTTGRRREMTRPAPMAAEVWTDINTFCDLLVQRSE